jgi:hypothetical protein
LNGGKRCQNRQLPRVPDAAGPLSGSSAAVRESFQKTADVVAAGATRAGLAAGRKWLASRCAGVGTSLSTVILARFRFGE